MGSSRKTALSFLALSLVTFDTPVFPSALILSPGIAQAQEVSSFQPQTITGQLDASDPAFSDGRYYETHLFSGNAGQSIAIEMSSGEFDTYLILLNGEGNPITENDDRDGTNSRIVVTVPSAGTYTLVASSYRAGAAGSYTLHLREASAQEVELEVQLITANRLNQQVIQLYGEGRYGEAIPLAQQALVLREAVLGSNHPDVASSLSNLALLYKVQGNYRSAEPLYQRSLSILERALGETHPAVATSLNNLAELYRAQGNYRAAEPLYQRSLSIYETALGENHPDVATSLNNLAVLYQQQGNYRAAEPLHQRSLSIRQTVLGENHPDVASSLNNLAGLYQEQGNYRAAELLYQRSLSICERVLGENHPDVAQSLNNLAGLYQEQGNYRAAEPLYQRSLSIRERVLGENHPDMAQSLNNLAGLYQAQGNYRAAEPLYQRSLSIRERALGENHPDVASSLNNLALLYKTQRNYRAAEPLYQRALSIRERALGENHPAVAQSLNNLAGLYQAQGNYRAAEPLLQRSLSVRERNLGENHPDVATSLNNLAGLYQEQGNYRTAELLYQRSLSIYETVFGENHPNVANSLSNLSAMSWNRGDLTAALTWMSRSVEVQETNLALMLAIGSETRKQAYLATLSDETSATISLHLQAAQEQPEAARLAFTTLLRRKGRVLEATSDTFLALRQRLTPENQALLDELRSVETQRANAVFGDTAVDSERLRELENRAEELQNLLAQHSTEFRTETQPVTIPAIQQQIPTNAVLVELVRYRPYNPTTAQERWGEPRYAAYVVRRDGEPRWVDLGEAAPLDAQVLAFREALRRSQSDVQTVARTLDAQLMQPIRALVGDATHVLISPDGQLSLIPFAALVDENHQYLIERYTFTYLSSGRELLRMGRNISPRQGSVLVANPDFGAAEGQISVVARSGDSDRPTPTRSIDFSTLTTFAPLPGTQQEAEAIAPLLPNLTLLEGSQATEERLKQVQGPSILHIATHGFFLQDQECLAVPNARGGLSNATVTLEFIGDSTPCIPTPRTVENPLLRSGLALAGVNGRSQRQGNSEDGILTAQEVAQLDLYGTQLVVLSACETGLGNVVNGEGVYGLRRAFGLAGAESQLMSLWKVDDIGTSQLMSLYYERLMAGEGRSAALRDVQLELLNTGAYSHPYYWASFIFSGEWHPLEE